MAETASSRDAQDMTKYLSTRRLALIGVSLGYFMVLFDTTALTVALPDLARGFDTGVQGLAWVTDGYTLTFAGCLLAGGVVADRHGADRTFLAGLGAFGALSLLCAAAPSVPLLVAARALLGVAGALLLPASLSLISALHPDPGMRARAIAIWAAISATALAAGPLLGGILVAGMGWRGVFLVNAPVALFAAFLLRARLPVVTRRSIRVDWRGQALIFITVGALTATLIEGGAEGWTGPVTLVAAVVTVVAGVSAVACERRSQTPAVPPSVLKEPTFGAVLAGGLTIGGALAGELFLTTLQLQELRGFGPILTGVAFLPLTVPMVLNPPLAGRLVARIGPARPVLGGLLLVTTATTSLALLPSGTAFVWIAAALAVLGLGVSFTLPSLTAAAVMAAPADAIGAASGLFSVARQVGATIGVAAVTAAIGGDIGRFRLGQALLAIAVGATALAWAAVTVKSTSREPKADPNASMAEG